jgi:cobalamin-dependent methionine synthase I
VVEPELAELRPYIDWTFFFTAWELKGRYPQILDHPRHGEAARELFEAANDLLDRIVADRSLSARGVYGFWPASAEGDDVVLSDGPRFPMLRQQADHGDDRPSRSLADYVAPAETGLVDHIGAFAVPPASGPMSSRDGSRRTSTTTTRSWSRRLPTAWRRRSPSGCTSAPGASGTSRGRR